MAICPVANSVGCDKCTIVKVCPLRSVVGNYGEPQPGQSEQETTSSNDSGSPPPS